MPRWVSSALMVMGVVVALMVFVKWLDSPSSDVELAYCQRASGTHPTLYERWVEGQEPTMGNYFILGVCNELRKEGLLTASCDVKTRWFREKFRHEEEADKIAHGEWSIYNARGVATSTNSDGTEKTVDPLESIRKRNDRKVEIACQLGL